METKYVSRRVGNTSRGKKNSVILPQANGSRSSTEDDAGIRFRQQTEKRLRSVARRT